MATINFPSSPVLNDQYSFEGKTWTFNGDGWVLTSTPTTLRIDAAFNAANSANTNIQYALDTANTANINAGLALETSNGLAANVQYAWDAANTANGNILTGDYKAVTKLSMDYNFSGEFYFGLYTGSNPDLYVTSGESLAISLYTGSFPFTIRYTSNGALYNSGITHVATDGTISSGGAAQGKTSGTLFINAPVFEAGNSIVYQSGWANTNQTGNILFGIPSPVFQETINATVQDIYDVANNAAAGADTWGRIHANAAFDQANTGTILAQAAFDVANTGGSATDSWARDAANSAGVYANAAYAEANLNYSNVLVATELAGDAYDAANSASSYSNASFVVANTAEILAQAAFDYANTIVSDTQVDPFARTQANASYDQANTATILAQAAYDAANNATDSWVRDAANSASSYANSAYEQANTATQDANSAGVYANSAYAAANAAYALAQSGGTPLSGEFDYGLITDVNNTIQDYGTL
jgi:hypothetical protein